MKQRLHWRTGEIVVSPCTSAFEKQIYRREDDGASLQDTEVLRKLQTFKYQNLHLDSMKSNRLLRIFDIEIKLHFSWYFVVLVITWSLATAFFPAILTGQSQITYWMMGFVSAILLFVSVLLHELSHSLVAKAKKIPVESITLFFFGGVASINDEDMKPSTELQMALAGPLFSLLLAGILYLIHGWSSSFLAAITQYLYQLNFAVGLFNLIPGFPLDGGRAFRAILYWHYQDLRKATRIAAFCGKVVAGILIFLGLVSIAYGFSGLWFIFLGGFLYFIANLSYEQVVIKEVLSQISVKDIVEKNILTIPASLKFKDFLKQHQYADGIFMVKGKNFIGLLDLHLLEKISEKAILQELAIPLANIKTLTLHDSAYIVFKRCGENNLEALPVVEKNKVMGLVKKKRVIDCLNWGLKFKAE